MIPLFICVLSLECWCNVHFNNFWNWFERSARIFSSKNSTTKKRAFSQRRQFYFRLLSISLRWQSNRMQWTHRLDRDRYKCIQFTIICSTMWVVFALRTFQIFVVSLVSFSVFHFFRRINCSYFVVFSCVLSHSSHQTDQTQTHKARPA